MAKPKRGRSSSTCFRNSEERCFSRSCTTVIRRRIPTSLNWLKAMSTVASRHKPTKSRRVRISSICMYWHSKSSVVNRLRVDGLEQEKQQIYHISFHISHLSFSCCLVWLGVRGSLLRPQASHSE